MRPGRGLTLVELIVTISLMLLGLGAIFVNIHRRPTQGGGELAKIIVNELRQARIRARATGSPRAFCIPTANGTTPCSQSYYLMSGHGKTAPRVVVDTSQQYPGMYLFVGLWSASSQSISSLIPASPSYPPVSPPVPPLVVADWMNPVVRDFVFTFNRDGRLATNDLPHDQNGNSYIVVSDGIEFTSATAPSGTATTGSSPPPYFQLTRVNQPWLIRISASGIVSLSRLMTNPVAGLVITRDLPGSPSLPPAPPAVVPALNADPCINVIDAAPKANSVYSPPFESTIPPTGRVSLTLEAYDPDGEDLSYQFRSTPLTTVDPGKFTYFDSLRYLTYPRLIENLGKARSDWVPPYGVPVGAQFKLDATVTDEAGHSTTSSALVTVDVRVIQDGIIAFDSGGSIWKMLGDGTLPQKLTSGAGDSWPELSPDCKNIVFVSNRSASYAFAGNTITQSVPRIWMIGLDGSGLRRVTGIDTSSGAAVNATTNTTDSCPSWSPDGSQLVFARTSAGVSKLQIIKANGSWVKPDLAAGTSPSWSPQMPASGKDIVYVDGGNLSVTNTAGNVTPLPLTGAEPVWCPDGTRFLYLSAGQLKEARFDGTSPATKDFSAAHRVDYNSSGARFVGLSGSSAQFSLDPGVGAAATNATSLFPSPVSTFDGHMSWGAAR